MFQHTTQSDRWAWLPLLCAAALLATAPARADIITAYYGNDTNFEFEVAHMPDFDQHRAALPNDGKMYCAPTATINLMAYLANHGYPNLNPGSGYWQLPSKYNDATAAILIAGGLFMATDPDDGTKTSKWFNGTRAWLNNSPYADQFIVFSYAQSGSYFPRVHNLAASASNGAMVNFAYGRYEYSGGHPFVTLGSRDGGHVVTLAKAHQSGSLFDPIVLESCDPAHQYPEFNQNTQSQFANHAYDVLTHFNSNIVFGSSIINSLNFEAGDGLIRVIDKYIAIHPLFGYGYTPGSHSIVLFKPFQIGGFQSPLLSEFDFSSLFGEEAIVIDGVVHPDGISMFAVVDTVQGPVLAEMNGLSGEVTTLMDVPTAKQVSFGRNRLLYVLEDDRLHEVNIDVVPERPGDPPPIQTKELPFMPAAVGYWDEDDKYAVLSTEENMLLLYRSEIFNAPPAIQLSLTIPLAGNASIAVPPEPVTPEEGAAGSPPPSMWIVSDAVDRVYRINLQTGAEMEALFFPEIVNPTGISVNDHGDLFVSTPNGLVQLTQSDFGGWMIAPDPIFPSQIMLGGEQSFERFQVARSRTNIRPEIHDTDEWRNVEPEIDSHDVGIPDCEGDLNHDHLVNVDDLLIVLNTWGECALPCPADANFDYAVNVDDLLIVLNNWGVCE